MTASAVEHLRRLGPSRRVELPDAVAGTVRLDMREEGRTEHWYLTIGDQRVQVSRSTDDAELVVRADREIFDQLARGEIHPAEALMRNEVTVQGDIRLFMLLRRIFPGPPDARHPRELTTGTGGGR
ncbi:SCP2 sterol-binding domain-containing protein [Micromonospora sp. C28SCA-DRY-2]|uniref:SCP2 sterol-binding domain-containing protein n=1 Tax=Micromonospora sp. C28SCA-DRY-2 TaxID=3059522 RepID=UPI00267683D4|nr:SCP2 sterol-binding domain-containing protein [Micromonospora sp. C28SCA-DRY-2]MDO3700084.1 SCP2 sterol-binding domain-containing protein [Micromonospora sp. C28SCA-DRY-2]